MELALDTIGEQYFHMINTLHLHYVPRLCGLQLYRLPAWLAANYTSSLSKPQLHKYKIYVTHNSSKTKPQ